MSTRTGDVELTGSSSQPNVNTSSGRSTPPRNIIFASLAVVVVVVVVIVVAVVVSDDDDSPGRDEAIEIAESPVLTVPGFGLSESAFLNLTRDIMDATVDPCVDFFNFTCRRYVAAHQSPEDRDNLSFDMVAGNRLKVLKFMFENTTDPILRPFYDSCFNAVNEPLHGWLAVRQVAERFNVSQWSTVTDLLLADNFNDPLLFDFDVSLRHNHETNPTLPTAWRLLLERPLSPADGYVPNRDKIRELLESVGFETTYVEEVYEIESWIADAVDGSNQFYTLAELETAVPDIDWDRIFARLGVDTSDSQFSLLTAEIEYLEAMAEKLKEYLDAGKQLALQSWARYVVLAVIDDSGFFEDPDDDKRMAKLAKRPYTRGEAELEKVLRIGLDLQYPGQAKAGQCKSTPRVLPYLNSKLRKAMFEAMEANHHSMTRIMRLMPRVLSRVYPRHAVDPEQRTEFCFAVSNVFFQDRVGKIYVDATWPEGSLAFAERMTRYIRDAWEEMVDESSWIDKTTRKATIEKLELMAQNVGHPPVGDYSGLTLATSGFLNNLEIISSRQWTIEAARLHKDVDRYAWQQPSLGDVTLVNAFAYPLFNSINLPAGLMAPPFFHASYHPAANFGGYGSVVGHEIGHLLDDSGREYDGLGFERSWWSDTAVSRYVTRQQCYVDQYDDIRVQGFGISGTRTLGENIADNTGALAAIKAYRKYIKRNTVPQNSFPGDLTNEQFFWVNFASNWCEHWDESTLQDSIADEDTVHAPGYARVTGTVTNSPEFAEAFNCPVGSPMNPASKCALFGSDS